MTAPSPWAPEGGAASVIGAGGLVTIVDGSSFCLSERTGDIDPEHPQGVFYLDTRLVARWRLEIDGAPLEPLAVATETPYQATFLGRAWPTAALGEHHADSEVVVFRRRHVGRGMREQITVHNHGSAPAHLELALVMATDFADVFSVKESRARPPDDLWMEGSPRRFRFHHAAPWADQTVSIDLSVPAQVEGDRAVWPLELAPKSSFEVCVEVALELDGNRFEPRFRCGVSDEGAEPQQRLAQWRADAPQLRTDHPPLDRAVEQAVRDLGALRIFDPEHPESPVVAAGAPWFMTLFGRDSLITSWMSLIVDPSLAVGVLETLARFQGERVDDDTEEEPGKILHEVRFDRASTLALGGGSAYYGSVDATPLFVMLLGELRAWGLADDVVDRLLPHADRALDWITEYGDRDGDGYVEYQRRSPRGLVNQGWKDSWDGISFADGRLPRSPVALCEVQGYTYAAYLARASFADEQGDDETAARWRGAARELKEAFNRDFWLPERGWFALGLDADKQPIDALASNVGHCLWTGIVDEDKAAAVAERLLSPELFSGWGVRTLATTMARYNPVSYHNGSVWPHDNALIAAGLLRYGFVDEAHRVIEAQLDAAAAFGGRLPELFAGISRDELGVPATYPASCSPQAWAAASPLLLLRAMLHLDPAVPQGRVHLAPRPLAPVTRLELANVGIDGQRVTVRWRAGALEVEGLDGLELVRHPRPPLGRSVPDGRGS